MNTDQRLSALIFSPDELRKKLLSESAAATFLFPSIRPRAVASWVRWFNPQYAKMALLKGDEFLVRLDTRDGLLYLMREVSTTKDCESFDAVFFSLAAFHLCHSDLALAECFYRKSLTAAISWTVVSEGGAVRSLQREPAVIDFAYRKLLLIALTEIHKVLDFRKQQQIAEFDYAI